MKATYDVAVLLGGPSPERDISLRSGQAVAGALRALGHRVTEIDIRGWSGEELAGQGADVAFVALHGEFGEDGQIQRILERRGMPYTGSGPVASQLAMDKLASKIRFLHAGLETPPYQIVAQGDTVDILEQSGRSLGYPVVIKPRAQGSSVGVSVHRDRSKLLEGAEQALRYSRAALMEKFIEGREITVGILDDRVFPIIELKPSRGFFDYAAKYVDPDTRYVVDPLLPSQDLMAIQLAALKAHRILGCEGATRVDMIVTPRHQVYVLEVNTIPGLTERSLLPKAARAAGIEYADLCDRVLRLAFQRRKGLGAWAAALL